MRIVPIFCILLSVYFVMACSQSAHKRMYAPPEVADSAFEEAAASPERMLAYKASMRIVVKNVDSLRNPFAQIAKQYEGYVQMMDEERAILRVKSGNLEKTMQAIALLGKVKGKSVGSTDITDEYTDYKIRLENSEKVRQRYLDLLQKAQNVTDMLSIERELQRVNTEIDTYKARVQALDQQASLATLTVDIEKKIKLGVLGYIFVGFGKAISWLFVRN